MKKSKIFISVLLVICLCLSMLIITGCDDESKSKSSIDKFNDAVSATNPTAVVGTVTMTASFGTMTMVYAADIAEDGSFVLNYSYDRFNGIEDGGATDTSTKVQGTVTYANGVYTGDTDIAKMPANAVASKLNLKSSKIDYEISNDGKLLTATVKAADTKDVLGVNYKNDVTMALTMQEGKIISLTLTYLYEGANVSVLCNYN